MINKILIYFFCLSSLLSLGYAKERSLPYPTFTSSVCLHGAYDKESLYQKLYEELDANCVNFFESLYYQRIAEAQKTPYENSCRIPKIVHQIWLGGKVPSIYKEWMESWALLKGWEYKLWTDEEVKDLPLYNRALFESVENFGEKSDILRLELLRLYGGVYVDTDFQCLNPEYFEELHHDFDFYIGIEPLEHGRIEKYRMFKFCNAIIASAPGHTLITALVENLKANYFAYMQASVIQRTGPSYITRIIYEYEKRGAHKQRNLYAPTTVFYPITIFERDEFISRPQLLYSLFPEAAGIHYWAQSWSQSTLAYTTSQGL